MAFPRFCRRADKGNDDVQADGNLDGHPKNNTLYNNDVYTKQDIAMYLSEADDNVIKVRLIVEL